MKHQILINGHSASLKSFHRFCYQQTVCFSEITVGVKGLCGVFVPKREVRK